MKTSLQKSFLGIFWNFLTDVTGCLQNFNRSLLCFALWVLAQFWGDHRLIGRLIIPLRLLGKRLDRQLMKSKYSGFLSITRDFCQNWGNRGSQWRAGFLVSLGTPFIVNFNALRGCSLKTILKISCIWLKSLNWMILMAGFLQQLLRHNKKSWN